MPPEKTRGIKMGFREKIQSAVSALAEVGALISELGFRLDEISRSGVENVALKLNSKNSNLVKENVKEGDPLVKLQYGHGCIAVRLRFNKNGTVHKVYEGKYYDEFGNRRSVYAKTQQECLKLLKAAHPVKDKKKPVKQKYATVKDWLVIWYNEFKKESLRDKSRQSYEAIINTIITPALGNYRLNALSGEQLQRFFNSIKHGNTRLKTFQILNACIKKAIVLRKVSLNPCDAVELPKFKKKKRRPFEYEEQNLILENANDRFKKAFFFLCATGLRVGEFLALTKDDFYLEDNCFVVNKSIVDGKLTETKTEASNRTVHFAPKLLSFFDLDLLGTYTYNALRVATERLFKSLNIKNASLHSTRHTFATICHSLGMNDKVLQSLLGHSTLAVTQDVYTHLMKKGTSIIYDYLKEFCTTIRTTF